METLTESKNQTNPVPDMRKTGNRHYLALVVGGLLLISHALIFLPYFPNDAQGLGHDYAYFFPALLDGFYWFQNNGLWEPLWFSPAACGGVPVFPNVIRGYYTVAQFLTFVCDPLQAVRLTLVIFALAGLGGTYLLLRRSFSLSRETALYGAAVFLFNGFFAHRMLIGHLGYCHYMLVPLIASLVLEPAGNTPGNGFRQNLTKCLLAGCLFAASVQSEFIITIIPAIIAITIIGLVHGLIHKRTTAFLLRLGAAGIIGIILSLARLTSILYLLNSFPRDAYKLPGAEGWLDAAGLTLRSLMISPAYDLSRLEGLVNVQFFMDRHEWEYSVTPIPFLVIAAGLLCMLVRRAKTGQLFRPVPFNSSLMLPILVLLLLPVALNTYYPAWNLLLKQLPVIGSASSLIRWIIVYIPLAGLLSALALEKGFPQSKVRTLVALACMAAIVLLNVIVDRGYYRSQGYYDPAPITRAWHLAHQARQPQSVTQVMIYQDGKGDAAMPVFRNDSIIHGASQLLCYEALFGYWLEFFPRGDLHPGPISKQHNGRYNLKNPVCYVWPEQNDCRPGEHFKIGEETALQAFAGYRTFPFEMPFLQKIANWTNACALGAVCLFFLVSGFRAAGSRLHRQLSRNK